MTSSLKYQLKNFHYLKDKSFSNEKLKKTSLLFNLFEAADFDFWNIYQIGVSGFACLCHLDSRFELFAMSVFHKTSLSFDRFTQRLKDDKLVNGAMENFLAILADYFDTRPALKVLEYLLRRFKIESKNTLGFFLNLLPYHWNSKFVEVSRICCLHKIPATIIDKIRCTGMPLSRNDLIHVCIKNIEFLKVICEHAKFVSRNSFLTNSYLSFYTVLICEILIFCHVQPDTIIKFITPYALNGLKRQSADITTVSLMILSLIARFFSFKISLLVDLLGGIFCVKKCGIEQQIILTVNIFLSYHPSIKNLSSYTFRYIIFDQT
jgi:U3 small nucleolar RNA-associated protein 10